MSAVPAPLSDPPPVVAPVLIERTPVVAPVVLDPTPVVAPVAPVALVVPVRPAPPRVERPSIVPPPPPERGWIASGFYVMTLPITIAVDIMLAPVNWIFGGRSGQ